MLKHQFDENGFIGLGVIYCHLLITSRKFGDCLIPLGRRGRLAQSGEHPLTTPVIQVPLQLKLHLHPWQKDVQPQCFNVIIQTTKKRE